MSTPEAIFWICLLSAVGIALTYVNWTWLWTTLRTIWRDARASTAGEPGDYNIGRGTLFIQHEPGGEFTPLGDVTNLDVSLEGDRVVGVSMEDGQLTECEDDLADYFNGLEGKDVSVD